MNLPRKRLRLFEPTIEAKGMSDGEWQARSRFGRSLRQTRQRFNAAASITNGPLYVPGQSEGGDRCQQCTNEVRRAGRIVDDPAGNLEGSPAPACC